MIAPEILTAMLQKQAYLTSEEENNPLPRLGFWGASGSKQQMNEIADLKSAIIGLAIAIILAI